MLDNSHRHIVTQFWDRLETEGESAAEFVRFRLAELKVCHVYVAKRISSGSRVLMFEIDTLSIPESTKYPTGIGFTLEPQPVTPGRSGKTRLILEESENSDSSIFELLVSDVAEQLARATNQSMAVVNVIQRLHRWQSFMRNRSPNGLSFSELTGLIGELLTLESMVMPNVALAEAVNSWRGYAREHHDFQLGFASIEVKTSGSSNPTEFHVSNVTQLDSSQDNPLFLAFFELEFSASGDRSIDEIVSAIRNGLPSEIRAMFDDGLIEAGYLDEQHHLYSNNRFSVRRSRVFEVLEGFPRIKHESLDDGIGDVSYSVALAGCVDFEISDDQLTTRLTNARESDS